VRAAADSMQPLRWPPPVQMVQYHLCTGPACLPASSELLTGNGGSSSSGKPEMQAAACRRSSLVSCRVSCSRSELQSNSCWLVTQRCRPRAGGLFLPVDQDPNFSQTSATLTAGVNSSERAVIRQWCRPPVPAQSRQLAAAEDHSAHHLQLSTQLALLFVRVAADVTSASKSPLCEAYVEQRSVQLSSWAHQRRRSHCHQPGD
jgi:hypothetical protein